ncbi:MAG: hypothetical protein U1E57_04315 [Paenacidovorax caeni]
MPVGDFVDDQVLDMSFLLGNLPERVQGFQRRRAGQPHFRVARGRSAQGTEDHAPAAAAWRRRR